MLLEIGRMGTGGAACAQAPRPNPLASAGHPFAFPTPSLPTDNGTPGNLQVRSPPGRRVSGGSSSPSRPESFAVDGRGGLRGRSADGFLREIDVPHPGGLAGLDLGIRLLSQASDPSGVPGRLPKQPVGTTRHVWEGESPIHIRNGVEFDALAYFVEHAKEGTGVEEPYQLDLAADDALLPEMDPSLDVSGGSGSGRSLGGWLPELRQNLVLQFRFEGGPVGFARRATRQ